MEQHELRLDEAQDFLGPDAPAQIHAATHHAGVRAGRVNQDAVETRGVGFRRRGWQRFNAGHAEARAILPNALEAVGIVVAGDETALVLHSRADKRRLAAGRGAEVEHGFARLRIENMHREKRARILHIEPAVAETVEAGERRMGFEPEDGALANPIPVTKIELDVLVLDILLVPALEERAGGGLDHVQPCVGEWRRVVPFEQPRRVGRTPALMPAGDKPFGVRPAEVRLGLLERLQRAAGLILFTRITAKERVDEASLRLEAKSFDQLDRLVHSRVIGHAIEPEKLVEAETQEMLQFGLLYAAIGLAGDEPVERGLPAHDAAAEFLAQRAIGRRERGFRQRAIEQGFDVILAPFTLPQHLRGNFSWSLKSHTAIMSGRAQAREEFGSMNFKEEFEKLVATGKITRAQIEPLVQLATHGYCSHRSWGFGKVTAVDAVLGRVVIDFQSKKAHAMDLAFAATSLTAIPKNHILARKAADLAGLRQMAALHHLDLVRLVLQSYDGRATADQIQQVLVPDVIADDYKKWWEVAKREMKTDGHFLVPVKKTEPIVLQEAETTLQDRLLTDFRAAKGLKAKLAVTHELVKSAHDLSNKKAAAAEVLPALNADIASHLRTQQPLALEAIFARDDLRHGTGADAIEGEPNANAIWSQNPRLNQLLEEITAAKHRRALVSFQESSPVWFEAALGIINTVSAKLCHECVQVLAQAGHLTRVRDALARLISQHQASSELLLWLAKERSDTFADILGPEVFRAMITAMERDAFNEKKSNRLRDFILSDMELIEDLIGSADIETIKDLTRALQLSPSFDDMDKRSLLARIVKAHPAVQSLISGEQHAKQDTTLIVSWASLERRKVEYEDMVKVQIPANSKEIAIARSYGDLRENHEYKAAKEMQKILMRRKSEIEAELGRSRGTDFANPKTDIVSVGTTVTVSDSTGQRETYTLLGAWDGDPDKNILSYLTPLAQALMGRAAGVSVNFEMEGSKKALRIESIIAATTLP